VVNLSTPKISLKLQARTKISLVCLHDPATLSLIHPVRILRMLTALYLVDEIDFETYTSNANTKYLHRPSSQGAIRFINGPTMKAMSSVVPYMRANGGKFIPFPDPSKGETPVAAFAYGMSL
jgi:hypothetical protein